MIGGAVGVGFVERILCRRLEGGVVVQHVRFVGVDVPVGGAGDLPKQAGVGQGVIQVAGLPVEDVRVGVGSLEIVNQVGVVVAGAGMSSDPALMASIGSSWA